MGETSRENYGLVLRRERACSKVRGKVLRIGEQNVRATVQSFESLLEQPSKPKGRAGPSQVCSQIVKKCLYLARNGRPEILWLVNKLARSVTK